MRKFLLVLGAVVGLLVSVLIISPAAQNRGWVLINGALQYAGSITITGSGQTLLPNGTICTAPAYSFSGGTNYGLARDAANANISWCSAGTNQFAAGGGSFGLNSAETFGWASGSSPNSQAIDTKIIRVAAGVYGYTTNTFANLGTPANGSQVFCTDCAPTTPASCPGTKASCVCTGSGVGSLAIRVNATWYCPF